MRRKPDFNNLLEVLQCHVPSRSTLFEFFMNDNVYKSVAPDYYYSVSDFSGRNVMLVKVFERLGYDYATCIPSEFNFTSGLIRQTAATRSLNEGGVIIDRESFDKYQFDDPRDFPTTTLDHIAEHLPEGMKILIHSFNGILENVISLVGYDNLCMMIYDDPGLVYDIFEAVGTRLVTYYSMAINHPVVGGLISNDDWGFKSQTMLSPQDLRRFLFPWHKKIVEVAHKTGKPAILHSCGNDSEIIDDVIYDMKYDGRHSFEDVILPVEQAYEKLCGKIAVLGGIDTDFMAGKTPEEIKARSAAMLERVSTRGGYALGTGSAIPSYVPLENYFAILSVVTGNEYSQYLGD